jgi:hypothetical protein
MGPRFDECSLESIDRCNPRQLRQLTHRSFLGHVAGALRIGAWCRRDNVSSLELQPPIAPEWRADLMVWLEDATDRSLIVEAQRGDDGCIQRRTERYLQSGHLPIWVFIRVPPGRFATDPFFSIRDLPRLSEILHAAYVLECPPPSWRAYCDVVAPIVQKFRVANLPLPPRRRGANLQSKGYQDGYRQGWAAANKVFRDALSRASAELAK